MIGIRYTCLRSAEALEQLFETFGWLPAEIPREAGLKALRFDSHTTSSQQSSYVKSRTHGRNTRPEMILRKAFWSSGMHYRVNLSELPGTPDIVFKGRRVAVFCDGDFFHGKDCDNLEKKLERRANASYWIQKIEFNRQRDQDVIQALAKVGFTVLRFWESDILADPNMVKRQIQSALEGGA